MSFYYRMLSFRPMLIKFVPTLIFQFSIADLWY